MRALLGFIGTTARILLGSILFAGGCGTALLIASGKYFENLPPNAHSGEIAGSLFVAVLMLSLGVVGLKTLTSLLRRNREADPERQPTAMHSLLGFIRAAVRIIVGSFLLSLGIAFVLTTCRDLESELPPNASPAYVLGWIIGGIVFPLIIGVVGFKMMTRRSLTHKSA